VHLVGFVIRISILKTRGRSVKWINFAEFAGNWRDLMKQKPTNSMEQGPSQDVSIASLIKKKIPSFDEAQKFISVFTRGRHLSYPKLCQSSPSLSLPISGRSIPMLSSQAPMRLPSRLFPSELPTPHQISLCTSHEQRNKSSVFIKGGIFPVTWVVFKFSKAVLLHRLS